MPARQEERHTSRKPSSNADYFGLHRSAYQEWGADALAIPEGGYPEFEIS
jgi:hypothetical protein